MQASFCASGLTKRFYAVPIPNGTLTFDELLEEAMDGKSVEPSIAKACVTEFMKAVKRNVLKGFRCQLGDNFLTVYPNLQLSVKDTEDPKTHEPIVATARHPDRVTLATEGTQEPWRQQRWRQQRQRGAGGMTTD